MPDHSPPSVPRPVVLLEINEVTNLVLDRHAAARPGSTLARLLATGRRLTTELPHRGLLEPWTAWPGVHRGIPDDLHGIFAIGQDQAEADRLSLPIWRRLAAAGRSVGVFAPFQAPHPPDGAEPYAFFVPTYFAEDDRASPDWLVPFHAFNRRMTQGSKHNVTTGLPLGLAARFLRDARQLGIRPDTIATIAAQLAEEKLKPLRRSRRRALQSLLAADVFLAAWRRTRPDFALLSGTNVAANLHRYWAASWPQDYDTLPLSPEFRERYAAEIPHALDVLDRVLQRLAAACTERGALLMLASAFGQAASPSQHTFAFLTLLEPERLLRALGIHATPREAPGMVPYLNLRLTPAAIDALVERLPRIGIGQHRFIATRAEEPLSFVRLGPDMIVLRTQLQDHLGPDTIDLDGRLVPLAEVGFGLMPHEDGVEYTARHVTEGSALIWDPVQPHHGPIESCSALDLVPSLLAHFGLPADPALPGRAFPLDLSVPALSRDA